MANLEQQKEEMWKRIQTGNHLAEQRSNRKLTLSEVGERLGVSATYISDIEKGRKVPSDKIIRGFGEIFEIGENEIFSMYGKIPLSIIELLQENKNLIQLLVEIQTDKKVTIEMKNTLFNDWKELFKNIKNN